jgi:phasin
MGLRTGAGRYAEGGGSNDSRCRPRKPRMTIMAESTETPAATPKSKTKAAPVSTPANVFEFPKFDMPKLEMPTALRELAEKGIAMAKENYDKMKNAAEEATDMLEETYSTASKGCSGYGLKLIETSRTNANAAFDLYGELLTVKSYAEAVELSTAYMRKQFDALTAQAKELAEEAQKVAADCAEPIKESLTSAFGKAA